MVKNIEEIKECPDCGSLNIIRNEQREQVICRDCGLIFEPLTPREERFFERAHELAPTPKRKPKKTKKAKAKKPKKKATTKRAKKKKR